LFVVIAVFVIEPEGKGVQISDPASAAHLPHACRPLSPRL
jgi:hypothetical protein